MRRQGLILVVLGATLIVPGCKESADSFFSGRPSGMAAVHNRIIGGPPEAMLELLRVPIRFPDAKEAHIASWQESMIAWWRTPEKRDLLVSSLRKLSPEESGANLGWIKVRVQSVGREKAQSLREIETAMNAIRSTS